MECRTLPVNCNTLPAYKLATIFSHVLHPETAHFCHLKYPLFACKIDDQIRSPQLILIKSIRIFFFSIIWQTVACQIVSFVLYPFLDILDQYITMQNFILYYNKDIRKLCISVFHLSTL